jgi:hypothetical protein
LAVSFAIGSSALADWAVETMAMYVEGYCDMVCGLKHNVVCRLPLHG